MVNRDNSFDLIRHAAALAVLISHHFALSGLEEPGIQGFKSVGSIAVLCFFSISGFLITQSFLNTSSLKSYMTKRVARIFPALIACAFMMVYIAAPLFSNPGGWGVVFSTDALVDLLQISGFGRAKIEGITNDFIFNQSFNGSLWTLKIEFGFYIVLAVILTTLRRAATPLMMTLAFCIASYIAAHSTHPLAPKLLVYSMTGIAFFVGSALYFYRNMLSGSKSKVLLVTLSTLVILVSLQTPLVMIGATLGVSLLTLSIGTLLPDRIIKSRFDISYGMYLYAFPVQQLLINKTTLGFYASMSASVVVVILLATLSWVLIEKPALNHVQMKSRARFHTAIPT